MEENNKKAFYAEVSPETYKWIKIYKIKRELRNLGEALDDLVANKRTADNMAAELDGD